MSKYLIAGEVYEAIERDIRKTGGFTVTTEHLLLLRRANVRWEWVEFGAPSIDGKRPYGNSNVERDIAEILNEPAWRIAVEEDERHGDQVAQDHYLSRNRDRLVRLHAETGIVLQIALATGQFVAGTYQLSKNYDDTTWVRVDTFNVPL